MRVLCVGNGQAEAPWEGTVSSHKYKAGQLVDYVSRASGLYEVTQLLPAEGEVFQYRIKSANEPHERVAKHLDARRLEALTEHHRGKP